MRTNPYQIALLSSVLSAERINELSASLNLPRCEFFGHSSAGREDGKFANHRGITEFSREIDLAVAIEPWTFLELLRQNPSEFKLPVCCGRPEGAHQFGSLWANKQAVESWLTSHEDTGARAILPALILVTLNLRDED